MNTIYGNLGGWQGTRLGGYRPHVFFKTGLELGLWMTAASLAGWWLWRCGALKRIGQIPFGSVLLPILMGTTILCRSTGALALLLIGMVTALAIGPLPDAAAAGRPAPRGPRLCQRSASRTCGPASRPWTWPRPWSDRIVRSRWNTASSARTCSPVRALAAAGLRMGRVGPQRCLLRCRHAVAEEGPDRRAVDHHPGDQGIRRPDAVLPGHDLAGGPVRPAISRRGCGATPGWRPARSPRCSWASTWSTAC